MKKTRMISLALLLSCSTMITKAAVNNSDTTQTEIVYTKEAIKDRVANMTEAEKKARVEEMQKRVEEIKAMDKSSLTKDERKALKKELKGMNKEAKDLGNGGIYLSLAAIIIIILLLIIIF
ncbi:MAG: hypothetical protein C5B52_11070 [Bacteroidetes bacterium]|nr:MAG: hypothetical protein C5B52_11070 [Bacteroidota bacterium]